MTTRREGAKGNCGSYLAESGTRDLGLKLRQERSKWQVIPRFIDQNLCAQSPMLMDMMDQG